MFGQREISESESDEWLEEDAYKELSDPDEAKWSRIVSLEHYEPLKLKAWSVQAD